MITLPEIHHSINKLFLVVAVCFRNGSISVYMYSLSTIYLYADTEHTKLDLAKNVRGGKFIKKGMSEIIHISQFL